METQRLTLSVEQKSRSYQYLGTYAADFASKSLDLHRSGTSDTILSY